MKKTLLLLGGLIAVVVAVMLLPRLFPTKQENADKLQVSASFYPLYYFAREIGGDEADVTNITPAGVEPHDYDPTPRDIALIQKSELIITNGAGFEPWFDGIRDDLGGKTIVTTTEGMTLHEAEDSHEDGEEHETDEVHTNDPHVWLDPLLAKQQVQKITEGYVMVDPQQAAYYRANEEKLLSQLDQLNEKFEVGLQQCDRRDFITSHTAFSYLSDRYNLSQISISGLSPDQEPSAQELAEIADFARENNITYIFFESLVSPKLSETLAQEVGAETLVLDPLEGLSDDDIKQGKNYFTVMENNLHNLQKALGCK